MAELKTKATQASAADFLNAIKDEQIRTDCWTISEIMKKATKAEPRMWGPSIVGLGSFVYKHADGREMDWMLIAFSPRKKNITLYIYGDFEGYDELMSQLGTYQCGKSCVYIKRLSDIHLPTLTKLIQASVRMNKRARRLSELHLGTKVFRDRVERGNLKPHGPGIANSLRKPRRNWWGTSVVRPVSASI